MKLNNYIELNILLISLFVTMVFNSCCRTERCKCNDKYGELVDDCTPIHYGPYSLGEVKDYLYFKPGSWWVYRNNLNEEIDSIYTTYCDTGVVETLGRNQLWKSLTYTTLAFTQKSDVYDVTYKYTRMKQHPDVTNFRYGQTQFRTILTSNNNIGPQIAFQYPFPEKNNPGYFEYIPVLNINGFDYTDIAVFYTDPIENFSQIPTQLSFPVNHSGACKYFWAKGYGLIQTETTLYRKDNGTYITLKWELIKSNLIR